MLSGMGKHNPSYVMTADDDYARAGGGQRLKIPIPVLPDDGEAMSNISRGRRSWRRWRTASSSSSTGTPTGRAREREPVNRDTSRVTDVLTADHGAIMMLKDALSMDVCPGAV